MKTVRTWRLIIIKNLILMLVILVVIIMSVFAWFGSSETASAEGISIKSVSPDEIELAVPEKNGDFPINNLSWTHNLNFKDSGFFKDLVKDVTSNGSQFAIPSFEAADNLTEGRKVISDDFWETALSSKDALSNENPVDDDQYNYISLDFYIRTKQDTVSIVEDSYLAAGSDIGYQDSEHTSEAPKPLTGAANPYRYSSYGAAENSTDSFSSDAIVGAMRVSLKVAPVSSVTTTPETVNNQTINRYTETFAQPFENASQLRLLWLPRPDIFLQTDNNTANWRLITGIKPSGMNGDANIDNIAKKTYMHSFYYGNTIENTNIQKGMDAHKYYDSAVSDLSSEEGADSQVPEYFKVSKVTSSTDLDGAGKYPKLNQKFVVADDPIASSRNIQFAPTNEEGDNRTVDGYNVYKCTLNVWIEGEDAEARRSMNNGVFSLLLSFGN